MTKGYWKLGLGRSVRGDSSRAVSRNCFHYCVTVFILSLHIHECLLSLVLVTERHWLH